MNYMFPLEFLFLIWSFFFFSQLQTFFKYCWSLIACVYVCAREKAMTPHSSTVARKIPWMEEPGRLQSIGLHRVRYDWRDLAAAVHVCAKSLCNPVDCSPPGSSVHRIFQARIPEGVAISSSRESSWSRDRTLRLLCLLHCRWVLHCWAIVEANL